MKRNELCTEVLYENTELGIVATKNNFMSEVEFKDEDTSIMIPDEIVNALVEIIPEENDKIYYLIYLITKAESEYNYSTGGYLKNINDKFQGSDSIIPSPLASNNYSMNKTVKINEDDFRKVIDILLTNHSNRLDEIIALFENLKEYEIVELFTNNEVKEIVSIIIEYINDYTLIEENEEMADDYIESRKIIF